MLFVYFVIYTNNFQEIKVAKLYLVYSMSPKFGRSSCTDPDCKKGGDSGQD